MTTARRVRGGLLSLAVLLSVALPVLAFSSAASLTNFPTATQAQQHCPSDTVVWLNLPTGVYHFAGEHWYGRTKTGAYVCQREADGAGMRATRNGQ